MEPSKTNQTSNTFTPSLLLEPFCLLCLVFVIWRVVDGSGVGSAGWEHSAC